ncbi:MAG TPA: FkbM family methyltransferase [Verrucomicrobiaceae bacterium]
MTRTLAFKLRRSWNLGRGTGGRWWRARQVCPPFFLKIGGACASVAAPETTGSSSVFVEIIGDDLYRKRLWEPRLPARPRILDIGANFGLFSSWLKLMRPDAMVTAIEPNPEVLDHLRKNAAAFGFDVVAKAVAPRAEPVRLSTGCDTTIAQLLPPEDSRDGVEVSAIPPCEIAALGYPRIDLLKCDCEGGEQWLLQDPGLLSITDVIVMEYHFDQVKQEWVREKLTHAGFDILVDDPSSASGHVVAVRPR